MKVIGLAGKAGSGKSTIARYLAQKPGIEWVDLDVVAWDTYVTGTAPYNRLLKAFGKNILNRSGEIDRIRLAETAFASHKNQAILNAIVHPAVSDVVGIIIREHQQQGTEILLIEGALLASSPHVDRSNYDLVVWLDVPDDIRAERLQAVGRTAHARRGTDVSPTDKYVSIPASGPIEDVASRIHRAIAGERD